MVGTGQSNRKPGMKVVQQQPILCQFLEWIESDGLFKTNIEVV